MVTRGVSAGSLGKLSRVMCAARRRRLLMVFPIHVFKLGGWSAVCFCCLFCSILIHCSFCRLFQSVYVQKRKKPPIGGLWWDACPSCHTCLSKLYSTLLEDIDVFGLECGLQLSVRPIPIRTFETDYRSHISSLAGWYTIRRDSSHPHD